jgi:hypothetical protein
VTQTLLFVVRENRFPHQALMNPDDTVRPVVIVNRRLLAWAPADHQHLDGFIATNSMAPVVAFLETDVRLEIDVTNVDTRNPIVQLIKCWRSGRATQEIS